MATMFSAYAYKRLFSISVQLTKIDLEVSLSIIAFFYTVCHFTRLNEFKVQLGRRRFQHEV